MASYVSIDLLRPLRDLALNTQDMKRKKSLSLSRHYCLPHIGLQGRTTRNKESKEKQAYTKPTPETQIQKQGKHKEKQGRTKAETNKNNEKRGHTKPEQ